MLSEVTPRLLPLHNGRISTRMLPIRHRVDSNSHYFDEQNYVLIKEIFIRITSSCNSEWYVEVFKLLINLEILKFLSSSHICESN